MEICHCSWNQNFPDTNISHAWLRIFIIVIFYHMSVNVHVLGNYIKWPGFCIINYTNMVAMELWDGSKKQYNCIALTRARAMSSEGTWSYSAGCCLMSALLQPMCIHPFSWPPSIWTVSEASPKHEATVNLSFVSWFIYQLHRLLYC